MNFKIIKSAKVSVKLTVVYAVMFSLVLLILNASVLYGIKYYLYSQANKQVEDVKIMVLNKAISKTEQVDLSDKKIISDVPSKENISIRIVKEDGKVLNISTEFKYSIKIKEPFDKIKKIKENDKHLVFKNLKIETVKYGPVYIQIVKDMENEYDFLTILFALMAVADFIGIIASILLGYSISKKMLQPIDYITKAADNISINNLKERIEVTGPDDELKRLGNTFNKMIDRLQGAFDRQIQFVSDASHELRTPIAVIQGYANLLDRWGKDDKEALEKSIHAIVLESSNMENLVEKLLFLAKGDSGNQIIEKSEFWLNELISEVVSESVLIDPRHIISSHRNDPVSIFADYKMMKQMLRIFIENSIKFTPEQGEIDISSEICNKTVKIIISDSGVGIPKDEIQNIFERFYIVDKSRSKEKGGTGLGLSIAKWIIEMHKGTINVVSEESIGTKITIILNI
ncbi:HAMP domain-containing histidine kinase [Clostridium estertheticum]|uniref:sensor histidine kinase n=1 Tax=Clostridium estertheticum TaxID=238834 RepID=UPI001651C80C|nr:ATP-binding protein [Clostridium estertheticum]MBZ9686080.1 HAMP domain-containing histidine kinase [Clostridium estertheticum]